MARYFRFPFGTAGDREDIPDPADATDGTVSYTEGYGENYSLNPATDQDALNVEREMFNQLAFDLTSTLQLYYQTGVPPFITETDNGGSAFSYPAGSRVLLDNVVYESTSAGNTSVPPAGNWQRVDVSGMDGRYARRSNNLSDLVSAETARTNLSLGTAAVVNTGTGSGDVPTTSNADGRYARRSNNLSDLADIPTARTSLGLGTAATVNVGTEQTSVPRNNDLGSLSTLNSGTGGGDVRTNTQNQPFYGM